MGEWHSATSPSSSGMLALAAVTEGTEVVSNLRIEAEARLIGDACFVKAILLPPPPERSNGPACHDPRAIAL